MRAALIAAILFAGLLNCAYSAPQPQPDEDTEAVLQELQTVLEQGGAPTPAPIQFLCKKSGTAEAQFLASAYAAYKLGNAAYNAYKMWDDEQARDQWITRKHVGTALKVANAAHRAWNDEQRARDQWLTRKHVGTALKVANAAHRAWNDQEARDQWLTRKHVGTALKVANAVHKAWNDQQARDQWLTRKHVGTALKVANAAHRAWNDQEARDQWFNRKNIGKALKVANAAHRAWNNQQLADAQGADQELADAQGSPAIVNFSCTPVKVNSNGEVTFLDLE